MRAFAALLVRRDKAWSGAELDLTDCETLADIADVVLDAVDDAPGPRLLLVEQDDEYAAILRLDGDEDEPRAFLSDGHAADAYALAAVIAEGLPEIGHDELADDDDAPPAHDSAPFGDPEIVADLGTPAAQLMAMCAHEGTLPIDLLCAVCEGAGCADVLDALRG